MSTYLVNMRIFFVIAVFGFVFFDVLVWTVKGWATYSGSHGPVILAISLYMVWTNRKKLKNLAVRPSTFAGAIVTAFGCFLFIAGKISSILLLQYLSFIVALAGIVWLLYGREFLKQLILPITYLSFMFPFFGEILGGFSMYLQNITAWIAFAMLKLAGITAYRTAQIIELPYITLEVAKACNGINHIMALVSLAIPLAYWNQKTITRKVLLVFLALCIGIFANGLRVAIIGIWSYYSKGKFEHGPFDIFYVSFIFFFGMILLVIISNLMGRFQSSMEVQEPQKATRAVLSNRNNRKNMAPFAVAIALFLLTQAYLQFMKPLPVYLGSPLAAFPKKIGVWKGEDATFNKIPFNEFSADTELKRIYSDSNGNEVKLYIGYFAIQDQDKEIINYRFDPLQQDARIVKIPVGGETVTFKNTPAFEAEDSGNIYFYYDINGRVLVNRYMAKLTTIFDALTKRRTNAAIVVISFNNINGKGAGRENYDFEFISKVVPLIRKQLNT